MWRISPRHYWQSEVSVQLSYPVPAFAINVKTFTINYLMQFNIASRILGIASPTQLYTEIRVCSWCNRSSAIKFNAPKRQRTSFNIDFHEPEEQLSKWTNERKCSTIKGPCLHFAQVYETHVCSENVFTQNTMLNAATLESMSNYV